MQVLMDNETSDILEKIVTIKRNGETKEYYKKELKMSYRKNFIR